MTLASQWQHLLDQHPPPVLEFVGTSIVQFFFFWVISAIYVALPSVFPEFSARHKLQKLEKQPTPSELWQCLAVVFRNQIVSSLVHATILYVHSLTGKRTVYRFDAALPGIPEILRDVLLTALLHDIFFYHIHRLLHHPLLYRTYHKTHHRFTAPVAMAAQYASVTEHVLANVAPILLSLMILKAHVVTFWIVLGIGLFRTTTVHSGFDFFAGKAKNHDKHHEKSLVHFGSTGMMDWLYGTDGDAKDKSI
ncbi:hypothetical protein M378DRAFT_181618 [Amanita muscaria Koide BX008]|uniref:Fatty acid hydroxylase domain-containing protein n=1 Tax=Amanita muscaria (strain Koide BX008) TaxID=946122 RepID=A0A0C2W8H2_AMAMK|nr:hypothetical protein M378DRAFT_181618 [Amanita muscaria Koide BX008]